MSAIGKIKASRVNNVGNVDSYVGEQGILFYNYANGVIRISDGITPGGVLVPYTIASNNAIGGIKPGPGANVAADGTLTIDTSGLPLSIGNLSFINTTISTLNPNVNLNLVTNGTGNINLVGAVNFYKPNGLIEDREPFLKASTDGQLRILVPVDLPVTGGIEIVGSAAGNIIQPGQPGALLHLTGNPGVPARIYLDGNNEYASFIARRWNTNVASPTQVLANQDVLRLNATAATTSGVGNVAMAQMRMTALENQTPTAQGSSITFTVTPIGSSAAARVDVANITVASGVTATKFTTAGNITAGNISVVNTISGYLTHTVRNAGVIADAGSVNIDFQTDDIIKCIWGNGLFVTYSNFIPGRTVKLIATKLAGTGQDSLNLDNISSNNTSTGSNTVLASADTTTIIEFYSTDTSISGLYAKI